MIILIYYIYFSFYYLLFFCDLFFGVAIQYINPFHASDLFWYPLKISEKQRFSDVFRGYQKRSVAWNGLIQFLSIYFAHYLCITETLILYLLFIVFTKYTFEFTSLIDDNVKMASKSFTLILRESQTQQSSSFEMMLLIF